MIALPARHRPSFAWPLVCAGALAVGCGARQSAGAGAAPIVAPEAPASAAAEDARAAPPPSKPSPDMTAVNVVTLIAKPGLWPLDVESARRVLQALGPVAREQPADDELALVGGPYGTLERYSVAYKLDDQKYWVFGSAGFFLESADRAQLYHTLEARLIELLGKPARRDGEKGAELPTSAWDLGEAVTLSLAPSDEGGEGSVRIAISEPDGDAD
jgi:hypothetical protein